MTQRYYALDGLRGWAAFVVMLLHIYYQILPPTGIGALRLESWWPFSGKFSVAVFFLVSGFSLSVKFLATGEAATLYRMTLGRYVRLIVPVLAACALMHLFMTTGMILPPEARPPHLAHLFPFEPTAAHLLEFGLWGVLFDYSDANSYAPPLWTISYEFFGSMLVASLLLFLGRPSRHRAAYVGLMLLLLVYAPWYALFAAGVFAAGLHRQLRNRISGRTGPLLMMAGMVLSALSREVPHVLAVSAFLFFIGALHTGWMRRFLSNGLSRVLGRISFPIYLLHVPVAFAVGLPVYMVDPVSLSQTVGAATVAAAASILAAVVFIPVNTFAMQLSRRVGAGLTRVLGGGRAGQPSPAE